MRDASDVRRRIVIGGGTALTGVMAAGLVATSGTDSSVASHGYGPHPTVTVTVTVPPPARPVVISARVRRSVHRNRFTVVCRITGGVGIERCRVSTRARVGGRRRTIGTGSRALNNGVANVRVRLNRLGRRALRKRLRVTLVVSPVPAQAGVKPLRKRVTLVRRG